MITYPVDVANTKWAVYRISTGQIIARNQTWPVADGSEITGLDPDYVYMLQLQDTPPAYDARLFILEGTETADPANNELRTTWSTVERVSDERKVAAENEEVGRMLQIMRSDRFNIETALAVGSLIYAHQNGFVIPTKMQTFLAGYMQKAQKLWDNRDRLLEIFAEIDNSEQPDLDNWPQ